MVIMSLMLVVAVAVGAGIGTFAYYQSTFTSKNNVITSAAFKVSADGLLKDGKEFSIGSFAPGKSGVSGFSIDKTGTDANLPIEYVLTFTTNKPAELADNQYLFRTGSPVVFKLVRYTGPNTNDYVVIDNDLKNGDVNTLDPLADKMGFGVIYEWPWETAGVNDNDFESNTGNIVIQAVAQQKQPSDTYADVYLRLKKTAGTTVLSGSATYPVALSADTLEFTHPQLGLITFSNCTKAGATMTANYTDSINGDYKTATGSFTANKDQQGNVTSVQFNAFGKNGYYELNIKLTGDVVANWYNTLN